MYGLINKAVEDLVRTRFNDEIWQKIKKAANVKDEDFISMNDYPDETTFRLVDAAAEILDLSTEELLEAFGEHWVLYTGKEGYGEMLAMAGATLPEFLQNLDMLHTKVALIMPYLRPPKFKCTDINDNFLTLHYYSERKDLGPMVIGLVKGLAKRFNNRVSISFDGRQNTTQDHDKFLVEWQ